MIILIRKVTFFISCYFILHDGKLDVKNNLTKIELNEYGFVTNYQAGYHGFIYLASLFVISCNLSNSFLIKYFQSNQ